MSSGSISCYSLRWFNVFVIKTKLWLVRSIINTESSETGSLIKIHCKLWEIWEPNSPIFLNACQWTKLALLAFLSKRHREILARSFPDFSRTTGQERTPRDQAGQHSQTHAFTAFHSRTTHIYPFANLPCWTSMSTFPSPNPIISPTREATVNVGLGEEQVGSFRESCTDPRLQTNLSNSKARLFRKTR